MKRSDEELKKGERQLLITISLVVLVCIIVAFGANYKEYHANHPQGEWSTWFATWKILFRASVSFSATAITFLAVWLVYRRWYAATKPINPDIDEMEKLIFSGQDVIHEFKTPTQFRQNFIDSLTGKKHSKHIAIMTSQAINYYESESATELWAQHDNNQETERKRIVVLVSDNGTQTKYHKDSALKNIIEFFSRGSDVMLVDEGDLETPEFISALKDCGLFYTENSLLYGYITYTPNDSNKRFTKSPSSEYKVMPCKLLSKIERAFDDVWQHESLRQASDAMKQDFQISK